MPFASNMTEGVSSFDLSAPTTIGRNFRLGLCFANTRPGAEIAGSALLVEDTIS